MRNLEDKPTVGTPEWEDDWSLIHHKQEDAITATANRLSKPPP
jgi:hypothetical protein